LSKTITPAFLFWVVGFLYAAEPEITKIKSSVSGVDQAVKAVYVSAEEKNSSPNLPNLVFKPDLASIEIEAIDRLIEDKSVPDKEKELTLIRYTMGDPRITGALIKAKQRGIKVTLITDLNPVMKGNFSQIQGQITAAFSKAELKDPDKSEGAKVIQELLDAGFELKKDILN
jgi:hypothetical protein